MNNNVNIINLKYDMFSYKSTAYITLADGTKLTETVSSNVAALPGELANLAFKYEAAKMYLSSIPEGYENKILNEFQNNTKYTLRNCEVIFV